MSRNYSFVSQYFKRHSRKGDWFASRLPDFLIDSFESKTSNSLQLDNANYVNVPPYACSFSTIPDEFNITSVADEDGQLTLMNISRPERLSVIAKWNCHTNAVFDTRWLPGEKCLLTASGDQTLALHDLMTQAKITSFFGHSSSVRSVDLQPCNANVFVSASRDGSIRLWDRRHSQQLNRRVQSGLACVHCINSSHQPAPSNTRYFKLRGRRKPLNTDVVLTDKSVTSVAFADEYRIASCGSTDGMIKIWDTRKFVTSGKATPSLVIPYQGESKKNFIGYSHVFVDHMNSRLFAVCRDHVIYQFGLQMMSPTPQMTYRGHTSSSFYIRASLSPDSRFLVCGSGDCNAYIYRVDRQNQSPVMLRGFEGEVTDVKWSPYDPSVIVALSDDCWVRVWRMNRQNISFRNEATTIWGLAERKIVKVRQETAASNIQNGHVKKSLFSGPIPCPNSPSVRQVNIESFLTPTIVGTDNKNALNSRSPNAFSLMEAEQVTNMLPVSPKKLVISPRKQSSATVSNAGTLKRRFSILEENSSPSTKHRSPARKRFRFDSSSENCSVFREIQNVSNKGSVESPRQNASELEEDANGIGSGKEMTPSKSQRKKKMKSETSKRPRRMSRKRSSLIGIQPITDFFPRSTP